MVHKIKVPATDSSIPGGGLLNFAITTKEALTRAIKFSRRKTYLVERSIILWRDTGCEKDSVEDENWSAMSRHARKC